MTERFIEAFASSLAEWTLLPITIGFIWLWVNHLGVCEWAGLPRPNLRQIAVLCLFVVLVS